MIAGPIYLAGPTASGKSAIALVLADRMGGEIVSVDSMQVYHGLDIGTAKPSPEERARVPHHLIDIASITEAFDAARFVRLAEAAETQIRTRNKVPIYCGGTGLYFKALTSGLGESPPGDAALRAELEQASTEQLLDELARTDPAAWQNIDRANRRRVVRAVEVIRLSGRPFSTLKADWKAEQRPGLWFGLTREREDLCARINERVDQMFSAGLVEETRRMLQAGLRENPTAMQALGYRQVVEHLDGLRSLAQTVELVKQKTRQYAKRQMTWFRRQLQLHWLHLEKHEAPEAAAERLMQWAVSPPPRFEQSPGDRPG